MLFHADSTCSSLSVGANDPYPVVVGATASDVTETVCQLKVRKNRLRSMLCN